MSKARNRRGAMIIMVAIVLVILVVGAVFSVDVAYMHMIRAELRTATDAAARAGSETLARTQDPNQARLAAIDIASRNLVAGQGLTIPAGSVDVGRVERAGNGRMTFVANQPPLTAVRVTGIRSDASPDGAVPLFFARFFSATQFQPEQVATAAANVRDVALVLDVSGSMNSSAGSVTRLQALKQAVSLFLDEVQLLSPHTLVSLSVYSSSATQLAQLTDNFTAIRATVNGLNANGSTAIGQGLLTGSNSLVNDPRTRDFAAKTVIVMTDGQHNAGVGPEVTVQTAVARNQQVHTVTFSSGANQALMRLVAQSTQGGIHVHADDAAALVQAFQDIARTLAVTLVE
ncbi:MAG: VWA domain-containing protein [Planctomycetales bacterium]|nr:VWA domain-containing protein [Planctomycetales bacterium]